MDKRGDERSPEEAGAATGAMASPRRSLIAQRYPTLARSLRGDDIAQPTIDDAATAAVCGKGAGQPVDSRVAATVGAHLGVDFTGVRVHQDPLSVESSAAMGARAFAHGGDVFLGAEQSPTDLGLLAHELTHVAQQGAAGRVGPQRRVEVGAADSPAEHEADQVAAAVTAGAAPRTLIVDDGPVAPGQILKSTFLAQLREAVTTAAEAELGVMAAVVGCPYIDMYFARYAGQPAATCERVLQRFAPGARDASTAADVIAAVTARVVEGVRAWRDNGAAPPDLEAADPAAAGVAAAAGGAVALRAPDGRDTLASLEAELGEGQGLDSGTASRMRDVLGTESSDVRVHAGPVAARKAAEVDAVAFAVGRNVVLAADAPAAGTIEGDALLAHELAHVAQQRDAAADPVARRKPIGGESDGAERDADAVAGGAVARLHGGDRDLAARAATAAKTDLQLQRCGRSGSTPAAFAPAVGHATTTLTGTFGTYTVEHGLDALPAASWGTYFIRILMTPNAAAPAGSIAFMQTSRRGDGSGAFSTSASDPGMTAARAARTDPRSGWRVDRADPSADLTPWYGMHKDASTGAITEQAHAHAGQRGGDQPMLRDRPGVLDPTEMQFVATATEQSTGRTLDAIHWGFVYDSANRVYREIGPTIVAAGSAELAGRDRAYELWNRSVATPGSNIDAVPMTIDPATIANSTATLLSASPVDDARVVTTLGAATNADDRARVAAAYQLATGRTLKADLVAHTAAGTQTTLADWVR